MFDMIHISIIYDKPFGWIGVMNPQERSLVKSENKLKNDRLINVNIRQKRKVANIVIDRIGYM